MYSGGLDGILKNDDNYSPWRRRYAQSPSLSFFLLSTVYHALRDVPISSAPTAPSDATKIRLVCVSDTHTRLLSPSEIPQGDILIHAGDLTHSGSTGKLKQTIDWLRALPHPNKIFIAGNHDTGLADEDVRAALGVSLDKQADASGLVYLDNEAVDITVRGRTLRVHGSGWTPQHGNFVFQYPRGGARAQELWAGLEPGLDVLVTHGPPRGHVDGPGGYGCEALLEAVWRVKPRVIVCGHIHAGRGVERLEWDDAQRMWERVVARPKNVGWRGMLSGVWQLVRAWAGGVTPSASLIVNCAIVGGFRDQLVRPAAVLDV